MNYSVRLLVEEESERRRLAEYLPRFSNIEQFSDRVLRICLWLHCDLSTSPYRATPRSLKDRRDSLTRLAKQLRASLSTIELLDEESLRMLRARVARRSNLFGKDGLRSSEDVTDLIEALASSADEASKFFGTEPGRPKVTEVRSAIEKLVVVWTEQVGEKPTLTTDSASGNKSGPFLDFCKAVLEPVYHANGRECPELANSIQRVLYPPKSSD